jgi:hypothetical protein
MLLDLKALLPIRFLHDLSAGPGEEKVWKFGRRRLLNCTLGPELMLCARSWTNHYFSSLCLQKVQKWFECRLVKQLKNLSDRSLSFYHLGWVRSVEILARAPLLPCGLFLAHVFLPWYHPPWGSYESWGMSMSCPWISRAKPCLLLPLHVRTPGSLGIGL